MSTRSRLAILALGLVMALAPARAEAPFGGIGLIGGGQGGGASTAVSCSNSLNFSQSCNSAYIAAVM